MKSTETYNCKDVRLFDQPGCESVVKVNKAVIHVHILIQGGHQVPGGELKLECKLKVEYSSYSDILSDIK